MKGITFLGAAGTVTGSSFFLREDKNRGIIIDLGMFQGGHEIERFNYDAIPLYPEEIEAVFLTHAHLDHSGRLPLLRRFGYQGPIYATESTKALVSLTLLDAAHIQQEHRHGQILYTPDDVYWVLKNIVVIPYKEPITVGSFSITMKDAGHILGSTFLDVYCQNQTDGVKKIVFSGDIGNFPEELLKPTEWPVNADVVVMESTYGDREHTKENPNDVLTEEITAVEESGGVLLIPAFSIERTQEILHKIDHLKKLQRVKQDTKVFLDSPLGIHVTHVYQQYRQLYSKELTEHSYMDDPFVFPGLTMIEHPKESDGIAEVPGPKVIIAGSGMMNGGRILKHAKHYLPLPTTRLLVVGFQANGTLGRALLDGKKMVEIDGLPIPVAAHIRKSSGMSSHADQPKLLEWLSHAAEVSEVYLVHGEEIPRATLKEKITKEHSGISVILPKKGETRAVGEHMRHVVQYGSSSAVRYSTP